jgi:hypothetical protein
MGTPDEGTSVESEPMQAESKPDKSDPKREASEKGLIDWFEEHSVRGVDNLRRLREENPTLSPRQINPLLEDEFISKYSDDTSETYKRKAIEVYTLTAIELRRLEDLNIIRVAIRHMKKKTNKRGQNFLTKSKPHIGTILGIGTSLLSIFARRKTSTPRFQTFTTITEVAVPFVKDMVNDNHSASPEKLKRKAEDKAQKFIDELKEILGKLPENWLSE